MLLVVFFFFIFFLYFARVDFCPSSLPLGVRGARDLAFCLKVPLDSLLA